MAVRAVKNIIDRLRRVGRGVVLGMVDHEVLWTTANNWAAGADAEQKKAGDARQKVRVNGKVKP